MINLTGKNCYTHASSTSTKTIHAIRKPRESQVVTYAMLTKTK